MLCDNIIVKWLYVGDCHVIKCLIMQMINCRVMKCLSVQLSGDYMSMCLNVGWLYVSD